MTNPIPQDELIALAREAEAFIYRKFNEPFTTIEFNCDSLKEFAQLIQQRGKPVITRERLVKLIQQEHGKLGLVDPDWVDAPKNAKQLADAILAELNHPSQEYEQMKADAERYRWLKNGCDEKSGEATRIAIKCYGIEWDEAIDAARAAGKNKL